MQKAFVAAAIALTITGCAQTPYTPQDHVRIYGPEPTELQVEAARKDLSRCLIDAPQYFDDGISDAVTIGKAVANSCAKPSREYARLKTYTYTQTEKFNFLDGWAIAVENLGRDSVLRHRAELKRRQVN